MKGFKTLTNINNLMPQNQEVINQLKSLGLNEYEAKAYHALNTVGDCSAGELSEKAELPRPRVYDVLSSLQYKGFVMMESGRPVKYSAIPLNEAINTLKKQKTSQLQSELERIEKNAESISAMLKSNPSNQKFSIEDGVWTIRGRNAIYSKLASMFNNAKDSIIITSTPSGLERKFSEHYGILKKARERGVTVKTVGLFKPSKFEVDAHITKDIPSRFVLVDNQALFFLTGEDVHPDEEVGLWLKSPHFVNTLKKIIK